MASPQSTFTALWQVVKKESSSFPSRSIDVLAVLFAILHFTVPSLAYCQNMPFLLWPLAPGQITIPLSLYIIWWSANEFIGFASRDEDRRIWVKKYLNDHGRDNLHRVIAAGCISAVVLSADFMRLFAWYVQAVYHYGLPPYQPGDLEAELLWGFHTLAGSLFAAFAAFVCWLLWYPTLEILRKLQEIDKETKSPSIASSDSTSSNISSTYIYGNPPTSTPTHPTSASRHSAPTRHRTWTSTSYRYDTPGICYFVDADTKPAKALKEIMNTTMSKVLALHDKTWEMDGSEDAWVWRGMYEELHDVTVGVVEKVRVLEDA